MTAREEQETTVALGRMDDVAYIYTNDTRVLRRLRNLTSDRDFVREVRGGDDWGEFTCDAENFYLFSAIRAKRTLSEAQREASAARLALLREAVAS